MTTPLNVLAVTSEIFPLVKTGGLADVTGALPGALAAEGVAVRSLVPGYPPVLSALEGGVAVAKLDDLFGGSAHIIAAHASGLDLFAIDAPHLYGRSGDPYRAPDGWEWSDNAFRFAALSRAATLLAQGLIGGYQPDVVHAHDWQAGLVPAYLHYAGTRVPSVLTIHNLAFQGRFPPYLLGQIGLPPHAFAVYGVEYYGDISYLKAGVQFADRITTVSPTYAAEICTPAGGVGMDGLLRARVAVLSGILNGVDTTVWDPAHDAFLAATFDVDRITQRAANKAALQQRFGMRSDPSKLLFGAITRLSAQKGVDLLLAALPFLLDAGGQLVIIGTGEAPLEGRLRAAAGPDVGVQIGYDEGLAHLIQGGADALLMPSLFEPCGLTQLCALRYGSLPVVAHVGGLCDTIIDANEMALAAGLGTGFHFAPVQTEMLCAAILRALSVWRQPDMWRRLQRNAMLTDVSWRRPAARYATLYRSLQDATSRPSP
ncbi:MAG TPA: glycogen synthase GlgA [Acetobacteraceae bacterium]|nr:glycogen synthase GlgA [Acetobacteraceae bacterium]